jgi:iron complex outermembrane receptor protein
MTKTAPSIPTKKSIFRQIIMLVFASAVLFSFSYAQKGTVAGVVAGSDGVLPLATVSMEKYTVLTDQQGKFTISIIPGNYTLIITHSGYKKIIQQITVEADRKTSLQVALTPDEQLGEVVVLGSRSAVKRSNLTTPVPVDVFSARQLMQTGQVSLTQMLNFSVPSINASRPIINEPITLRGLNPDQVLILVNGTRRHNMAIITPGGIRGVLGNGTVPNDLNSIPFSAIEKIEILRDGAAAQYGSDAIAGVINIVLKKSTDQTNVQLQTGQYYLGDGKNISIGISRGITLNKKGILNVSGSFCHTAPTYRGGEFKGTVYYGYPRNATHDERLQIKTQDDLMVATRGFNRNQTSNAGSSEHTTGGVVLNGSYPLGKKTEIFWTAIANRRKTTFNNGYTFPKDSLRVNPLLFPDGYNSHVYHYTTDISGIAGIKGEMENKIAWEYTAAYGNNTDKWYNKDVNNASQYYTLGKDAPTQFYTGTLIFGQLTNNLQVSKRFSANAKQLLNLSWGAEWRHENFQMKEGEEASYQTYDSRKIGGVSGEVVPLWNTVNRNRNVTATYADLEMEFAQQWSIDVAGRYEHYSDFGSNLAGKIAARYKFSEKFTLRGSFNNGFRAPSLQQRYYSGTNITGTSPIGEPTVSVVFRNNSDVAKAFGVPSLQAERSLNVSGGMTAVIFNHIQMTADAYWIQIKDRIVLGGEFETSNSVVRQILLPYPEITAASFFSNAINTTTHGVDVVLNGHWKIQKGSLTSTLGANFTQTRLFGSIKTAANIPADSMNINTLFDRHERGRLERGQPDSKIILTLNYKLDKFGLLLRNTRFGRTAILSSNLAQKDDETFSSKILTDFSLTYTPAIWLNLTLGANNVFNIYPDKLKDYRNTQEGRFIYSMEAVPFGYYGGYYYLSINFTWRNIR